jgi:carbon storage regulator CsrA
MLVLSRKLNSSIHIGPDIEVKVLEICKSRVRVGIDAPSKLRVWRDELPKVEKDSPPPEEQDEQLAWSSTHFDVLLVEDDPGHAKLICGALAESATPNSSIDVSIAKSGELALEALQLTGAHNLTAPPFDLILLDLNLPRMTGLDVLRQIRDDSQSNLTPVVMLSCSDDDGMAAECLQSGANAYVTKSGDPKSFRDSVSRIAGFWSNDCRIPRQPVCLPR